MKSDLIVSLFDYSYWAFDRVWACIEPLTDEQFTLDVPGSAGSIRNQVVHLASATTRWVLRLQGAPLPEHLDYAHYPTRAAARQLWDAVKPPVLDYVRSLSDAALDEPVRWELPARGMLAATPRWQVLAHLANHATDHRAQILTLMGVHFHAATVEQDLIFYYAER